MKSRYNKNDFIYNLVYVCKIQMSVYYKKRVISPAEENISLDVYKNHNKNLLKEFVMTVEDVPELRKNYLVGKTYMRVGAGSKIP